MDIKEVKDRVLNDIMKTSQFSSPFVNLDNKKEWLKTWDGEVLIPGNIYKVRNEFCVYAGDFTTTGEVPKVFCCYTIGDQMKVRHVEVDIHNSEELPFRERRKRVDDDRPIDTTVKDTDNTLMLLIKGALQYRNITRGDFKRFYPNISEMNNILRCIEKGENLSWVRFTNLIEKLEIFYRLSIFDDKNEIICQT
jgi:hypothetical protein